MRARLVRSALISAAVFLFGTLGYQLIEDPGWWRAFYMTVITLTTVGYGEVFSLSTAGQVFTVVLLVGGLGIFLYLATDLGRSLVEIELRQLLGQVRRSRMIERLNGHEIVCGWGRMGQAVVGELLRDHRAVVVVEQDPQKVRELQELKIPVITGDATTETALRAAGIDRAHGLVSCLPDDAHNVYTVLTARFQNAGLFIVVRASEAGAEARIRRAGADRVVNPYHLSGVRLAHLLVKPAVVEFVDFSLGPGGDQLRLEQVLLPPASSLVGSSIADADLRRRWGIGVVAVCRGRLLMPNPEPQVQLEAGDILVILGTGPQLEQFEAAAMGVVVER